MTFSFFNHENTPVHHAKACSDNLTTRRLKLFEHPSYSSELALCDFAVFPYVKIKIKMRWYSTVELFEDLGQ